MKIKKMAIIISVIASVLLVAYFYLKINHAADAYANLTTALQSDIVQLEGAIDYQIENNWHDQNNVIEKIEDVRESINYLMVTGKNLGIISQRQEEDLWKLERFFVKYPTYTGFPNMELSEQEIKQLIELKDKLRYAGWGMNIGYGSDWSSLSQKTALLLAYNSSAFEQASAPPDQIELKFAPVQWAELPAVEPSSDWQLVKTIPFGKIGESDASLDIFEAAEQQLVNAILTFKDHQLLIPNISNSLLQNDQVDCSQICLFQQYFSGQHRYQLIGSLDISLNGPGLYTYIVYDEQDSKMLSVDLWGEPGFADLDNDGEEEFVIEFQGLHLSPPDLSIIRTSEGNIEISNSIFDSINRNQGDFAVLKQETTPITINISNVNSYDEPIYEYTYEDGVLMRKTTQ